MAFDPPPLFDAMKAFNQKVKVQHSFSKSAWNIVGTSLGHKYKIARFPYFTFDNIDLTTKERTEAFNHAQFCANAINKE